MYRYWYLTFLGVSNGDLLNRAVGAGPAGPAAAGPIFGQLTRAKMPYRALVSCSIVALKVATLEGTSDDSCHPQDFCWGCRKAHFVTVSFGKLRSE